MSNKILKGSRNIAVYKRDGSEWTQQEAQKVITYLDPTAVTIKPHIEDLEYKWIFDDGDKDEYSYPWSDQEDDTNFANCLQIAYEDLFSEPKLKIYKVKP